MDTKNLGIHRMVLNFSFLPLQALERSIVCKLYLKYSPSLQLGSQLRKAEEPPPPNLGPSFPPTFRAKQGGGERAATENEAGNNPAPTPPLVPGTPISQWKEPTSSGVEGSDQLVLLFPVP